MEDIIVMSIGIEHYIVDDKKELVKVDLITWDEWYKKEENRRVAHDFINGYCISTIFLAIDHSWGSPRYPLFYETMVFSPSGTEVYMTRHSTWREAEIGHLEAVDWVKSGAREEY